jgi:chromosome segregation protein
MTKINKLVMKGFKSFANKTEINFGNKFNCILGPNGSGKSNVLDALCFVLGKSSAKGLRAEKSANLIYNGGKKKAGAKEGLVSIYFDNTSKIFGDDKGEEVEVTRIVKKSGQSVYKLNGETVTRQQTLDLLSRARINPDGYNIILQGDIIRMVDMTPMERRGMVEEIAGISIYEEKKNKALRELSRVEEKLNEAQIILAERETYLKELKKERNQALKFKELNDNLKRNKATVIKQKLDEKNSKKDSYEKGIKENEEKIAKLKNEVTELEKKVGESKREIEDINKEVEQKGEKDQVELHKEIEKIKVDVALNNQRVENIETEIKKLGERKKGLQETKKELGGKISVIEKSITETEKKISSKEKDFQLVEKKIADFRKKNNMEDAHKMDEQIEDIDKKADVLQEETHKLREKQQNLLRDKDKYELMSENMDEKIAKVLGIEKEHKSSLTKLKKLKEAFSKKEKELSKAIDYDSDLSGQLATAKDKLSSRQEEESRLRAKSANIQESMGASMALKNILELKKKGTIPGIIGTVSELGKVKDEYATALEVAAGGAKLSSIVVETDKAAADCIKHLKKNKLGIATFLPLNKLRSPKIDDSLRSKKGVKGLAVDLISFEEKYRKVFEFVFGNTLVVDDIETGRKLGVGTQRMVTLTGDVIERSGAMQGGFRQRKKGLGFQNKEVTEKISKLEKEISDLSSVVNNLNAQKKNNELRIDALRKEKAEEEAEIIKLEKSLHLDSSDLGANKKEKERIESELRKADEDYEKVRKELIAKNTEITKLKGEKQKLRESLSKLRSPALLAELNSFDQKKKELTEEISRLKSDLRSSQSEMKNILGPEGEKIQGILKQQEKEEKDFADEKIQLQALIKDQNKELVEKEKKQAEFYKKFKDLFSKRNKLSDQVSTWEATIKQKEENSREIQNTNNGIALKNASVKAEIAGLNEEYKEYEGIPIFKDKELAVIEREIKQFEKMMADIGAVNMKALEIYDKAQKEYESLLDKKEKLGNEREDVLVMINEIESKKKELFMRTYNILNENFKRIFKTLTTKGEASYDLENPKEPLEGGLTIKVKLSSKKFMDIRSLSGGEKTLTALAFLFAVQEYNPASFYVMDEVDAALDKHNSEKLANLVRGYCKNAQYIIISHNDSVIGEADNLYGVSMNENSQTKVTSLKV